MAVEARVVANQFIGLARKEGKTLTPLQLMKLVYIAHGWMLGLRQRPLIIEPVEAWRYGPIIPELYRETKKYGSGAVTDEISTSAWKRWGATDELDASEADIVEQVYRIYGGQTGIQLSSLTHQPGTPWDITWESGKQMNATIPSDLIAEHYRKLALERTSAR